MRQITLESPSDSGEEVRDAIEKHGGTNTVEFCGSESHAYMTILPNDRLNNLLNDLSHINELRVSIESGGAIALYPPQNEKPEKAIDVAPRSSLEIYLNGIQSVGSKFGLVGYSISAAIIVWIGFYANIVHLLVAGMLVAPFAGPAMNSALATAAGRQTLLIKSIGRYGLAIGSGVLATLIMSFFFPIQEPTSLMVEMGQVSAFTILLPLVAGFAGGINVCQSQQDSLVSGAAVGILVAASLAPPVGLLGIGIEMGNIHLIRSSAFRVILQLLGIHFTATLVFFLYGKVRPNGVRFLNGNVKMRNVVTLFVLSALAGMMFWQFSESPNLARVTVKSKIYEEAAATVEAIDGNSLLYHHTVQSNQNPDILLVELTLLKNDLNQKAFENAFSKRMNAYIRENNLEVEPIYNYTWLNR